MQYSPHWLDYAAWALGIGGGLCLFGMMSEPVGVRRGRLKLAGCVLLGLGAMLGGAEGALFNARAAHLQKQGQIFNVARHSGRSSSTKFSLRSEDGQIAGLTLSADVPAIVDGELAEVVYQADSYVVLHVTIQQGIHEGFQTDEPDGMFGSWAAIIGGLLMAAYGVLNWITDGTGIPSDPQEENCAQPDGDVDQSSLLHLNSDE